MLKIEQWEAGLMTHKSTIKGLLVKRGKKPVVVEINNNNILYELQQIVGGLIDCVELYNPDGTTDIILNAEGKIDGICKPNRVLTYSHAFGRGGNKMLDVIYGDFILLCVDDEGRHISLTEKEIKRWSREFENSFPPKVTQKQFENFFKPHIIYI